MDASSVLYRMQKKGCRKGWNALEQSWLKSIANMAGLAWLYYNNIFIKLYEISNCVIACVINKGDQLARG